MVPSLENAGNCQQEAAQGQKAVVVLFWSWFKTGLWWSEVFRLYIEQLAGKTINSNIEDSTNNDRHWLVSKDRVWVPSDLRLWRGKQGKIYIYWGETTLLRHVCVQVRAEPALFFKLTEWEVLSSCSTVLMNSCHFIVLVKLEQPRQKLFNSKASSCRREGCRNKWGWKLPASQDRGCPRPQTDLPKGKGWQFAASKIPRGKVLPNAMGCRNICAWSKDPSAVYSHHFILWLEPQSQ